VLIRVGDKILREFPDELAALILADPSCDDGLSEFTANEVNVLIHGIFGTHYDPSVSYERNIEKISKIYFEIAKPSEESYLLAREAVNSYNQEISQEKIGLVDTDDLFFHEAYNPPDRLA